MHLEKRSNLSIIFYLWCNRIPTFLIDFNFHLFPRISCDWYNNQYYNNEQQQQQFAYILFWIKLFDMLKSQNFLKAEICYYLNSLESATVSYFRYFINSSCVVLACSIIDFTTPTLIGSCLGTVNRLPSECFSCIWLPLCLSIEKP